MAAPEGWAQLGLAGVARVRGAWGGLGALGAPLGQLCAALGGPQQGLSQAWNGSAASKWRGEGTWVCCGSALPAHSL